MEENEEKSYDITYHNGSGINCCYRINHPEMRYYMELENKARELSKMIIDSDVYQRYISAKENLERNTELKVKVDEYRKKNFFIQNKESNNKLDELKNLFSEYYEVLSDKNVKEYMDCELILCRTLQQINEIIVDGIDFDVDFISS